MNSLRTLVTCISFPTSIFADDQDVNILYLFLPYLDFMRFWREGLVAEAAGRKTYAVLRPAIDAAALRQDDPDEARGGREQGTERHRLGAHCFIRRQAVVGRASGSAQRRPPPSHAAAAPGSSDSRTLRSPW